MAHSQCRMDVHQCLFETIWGSTEGIQESRKGVKEGGSLGVRDQSGLHSEPRQPCLHQGLYQRDRQDRDRDTKKTYKKRVNVSIHEQEANVRNTFTSALYGLVLGEVLKAY